MYFTCASNFLPVRVLLKIVLAALFFMQFQAGKARAADSLQIALELHQAFHYDRALPIFIRLSETYEHEGDFYNYALCKTITADIIRSYGGVQTSLEMFRANEQFLTARFKAPTLLLARHYLAKAEAFYESGQLREFKAEILKSLNIKKTLQSPEHERLQDYVQLARYYLSFQNQHDSSIYWITKALKTARASKEKNIYGLPQVYNLLGNYHHPASRSYFSNNLDVFNNRLQLSRKYYDSALYLLSRQRVLDELTLSKIYHNLGNSYSNEYTLTPDRAIMAEALHCYTKSIASFENWAHLRCWLQKTG